MYSAAFENPPAANQRMSHLVIGCGYLGSRVAARWQAAGHHVLATTRSPDRAAALRRQGMEPVVCDVLDPASLRGLPQADTVLHAVGYDRAAGAAMRDVYVRGLENVLAALPTPGRLVYASSTGVYGQEQGEEVDESAVTGPLEESGRIVLEAEQVLRGRVPQAIVLRFAGMYGPGRLLRRQALLAGEPLGSDPQKWLNLIQIADGAAAVDAAVARGRPGATYNVADGQPVRRGDFYALLARLLGAPPPRFLPPPPGQAAPPERAHRRIVSRRLREELGLVLRYPSYLDGLPASLDEGGA